MLGLFNNLEKSLEQSYNMHVTGDTSKCFGGRTGIHQPSTTTFLESTIPFSDDFQRPYENEVCSHGASEPSRAYKTLVRMGCAFVQFLEAVEEHSLKLLQED